MSDRVSFIWTDDYLMYDFGPQHPLKPVRVQLTVALARAVGLFDLPNVDVLPPRDATRAELERIHAPAYLDAVEHISHNFQGPYHEYGWGIGIGDNPAFPGMHEASVLVCGGGVVAAEQVWRNGAEHSWYPAGGLHHAMRDRASGFCIYDDPAVSIAWLLDNGASKVAYIDVDVHHGDGVQAAFYDDPRVLTISLHESGHYLFPGTGFVDEVGAGEAEGTSVNVPLPPYTHDHAWRAAFERVVPPLVEAFAPDVLFTQLGCDTHATDPLAHLALTTSTYRWTASMLHEIAHRYAGGKWIATGGGGYQIYAVVPRAWTIYAADLAGAADRLPDRLPDEWMDLAKRSGATELSPAFDDPKVAIPQPRMLEATDGAKKAADDVVDRIFPYYGL